jgi:hypothetical protein
MEILPFLLWPFMASLILTGIHAYLGVHVVERGVIFVDLALAQIAALGATVAILAGMDPHGLGAYWPAWPSPSWARRSCLRLTRADLSRRKFHQHRHTGQRQRFCHSKATSETDT